MKMRSANQLKARVKNLAIQRGVPAGVVADLHDGTVPRPRLPIGI